MTDLEWLLAGVTVGFIYFDELSAIGEFIGRYVGEFLADILFNRES